MEEGQVGWKKAHIQVEGGFLVVSEIDNEVQDGSVTKVLEFSAFNGSSLKEVGPFSVFHTLTYFP